LIGFSYEYLSPDNFALPEAHVAGQTFAAERQAFKALIVGANVLLTGLGVTKLSEYAHAGLPVIFLGGIPSNFEGYDQTGFATVNATISSLTSLRNVHVTSPNQRLASVLSSLNISPRTAISANGTWYTYWREGALTDYIWIYNGASNSAFGQGYSTGSITFEPLEYLTYTMRGLERSHLYWATHCRQPILQYSLNLQAIKQSSSLSNTLAFAHFMYPHFQPQPSTLAPPHHPSQFSVHLLAKGLHCTSLMAHQRLSPQCSPLRSHCPTGSSQLNHGPHQPTSTTSTPSPRVPTSPHLPTSRHWPHGMTYLPP
jgi:hypothetical protein